MHKNLVAAFELSERNWSLFGNIFSKTKMAMERAKKLSYIQSNNDSGGIGADEVALSLANVVIKDEEEAEEWRVEKVSLSEMCWKYNETLT